MPKHAHLPRALAASALTVALACCTMSGQQAQTGGQPLQGGTFENAGGVIEEPSIMPFVAPQAGAPQSPLAGIEIAHQPGVEVGGMAGKEHPLGG